MERPSRNCSMVAQTEMLLAYICPGCLGVFDEAGICDDCRVALTENVIQVSHPHDPGSSDGSVGTLAPMTTTRPLMNAAAGTKRVTKGPLLKASALLFLVFGTYFLVQGLEVQEFLNPERIVAYLHTVGPLAPVLFILLMAAAVVISPIPSLPLDLAAGATFGVVQGTAYSVIGAEIGAVLSFLIGRGLGREALSRLLRAEIRFCERCSDRHLVVFVFLARLFPVFSFDLISYGAGLTNMSLRTFAVATFLGMIPPTLALTILGGSLFAEHWLWIVAGAALTALFLLIPRLLAWYPSAWWVRLLRGDMPIAAATPAAQATPIPAADETGPSCASCGAPAE